VTQLVNYIFSAGGAVTLLLAFGLWLWKKPGSPLCRRLLLSTALFYMLASTFGVTYNVGRLLSAGLRPFEAGDVQDGAKAVWVLGSGSFTARDWDQRALSIVDPAAATRVLEAYRVFRLVDPQWVITSGGRGRPSNPNEPTALTMKAALVALGVPESRIIADTRPLNTREEVLAAAALLKTLQVRQTILVTSDTHMRRSLGAFSAEGLSVIPAIARHPDMSGEWFEWMIPTGGGLAEGSLVAHEILGIGYYAARGWYK
jgi:uncharacterized SAM-binding protein YcdF (DUF218 family)